MPKLEKMAFFERIYIRKSELETVPIIFYD